MPSDWQELTRMTGGEAFVVERVRLTTRDIAIEGSFEPPALVGLAAEDQVFVAAFVKSHGSIKRMEAVFGISYPTVKNRLNRIAASLDMVEIDAAPSGESVIDDLEAGRISVDEALREACAMNVWFRIRKKGGPAFQLFVPEILVWSALVLLLVVPFEFLVVRAIFAPRHWRAVGLLPRVLSLVDMARGLQIAVENDEMDFLLAVRS